MYFYLFLLFELLKNWNSHTSDAEIINLDSSPCNMSLK